MGALLIIVAVVLVLGGLYIYTHQGQSTTVKNPNVDPHATATHGLDQLMNFIQTKQGGVVMACLIIAVVLVSMWKKLGKGTLVTLAIIVAIAVGASILK